jgi:hypothetical protein
MNQDYEEPESFPSDAGELPDSSLLAEIERRLKSARPRPPCLDLAVIERLASEAPAPTGLPPVENSPTVVLKPRTPERDQLRRFCAAVAGSWMCGVLVGAIGMFWYTGSAPPTGRSIPAAQVPEDASRVVTADRNTTHKSANGPLDTNASVAPDDTYAASSDTDRLVFAVLPDLNKSIDPRYERPGGTLRARMHLSDPTEKSWSDVGDVNAQRDVPKDGVRTSKEGLMPDQDMLRESPPVTRERLLRELQGDTFRRYL